MIRNINYVFVLCRIPTEDLELNVHIVVKIFHRIISADGTNCRTGLLSFIFLPKFVSVIPCCVTIWRPVNALGLTLGENTHCISGNCKKLSHITVSPLKGLAITSQNVKGN